MKNKDIFIDQENLNIKEELSAIGGEQFISKFKSKKNIKETLMSNQQNNKNQKLGQDAQAGGKQFVQNVTKSKTGAQSSAGGGKPFVNKLQPPNKKNNA